MFKKIAKILSLSIILFYGCDDSFLEVEPSDRVSAEQLAEAAEFNPDIVKGGVAGLYQLMYFPGTGGTTGNDDFGQKGVDIWSDMLSGDIAHSKTNYGWYSTFSNLQASTDFTANENYIPWRYYYRIIRNANKVIETLGGNDATPDLEENKFSMGQAKAMRAYSYFYLLQLYTDSYDLSAPALPIYITPVIEAVAKSTQQEVYDLIYKDLNQALSLLQNYDRGTSRIEANTDVVKMLLAYAYASQDMNWDKVKTLTGEVINSGYTILPKANALDGMNFIESSPGWIWASDIKSDDNISLTSFYSQMDYFTYGYASVDNDKAIDVDLFNTMPADDVRRSWFSNPTELINWRKYYDPNRQWDGQRPVTTDVHYMRISEVYLLNAEAAIKTSDLTGARTSLKAVVSERVNDASYIDGLDELSLRNEIFLQTRLELWAEGKSYLLKRRNKLNVVRGANHLIFVGDVMSYDDDRLSFEIPQAEILNNPFINLQN